MKCLRSLKAQLLTCSTVVSGSRSRSLQTCDGYDRLLLGLLHLIRADTVSAYQRIRLFVWANSVKSPILIRTRKFLIQVTFQPSICKYFYLH